MTLTTAHRINKGYLIGEVVYRGDNYSLIATCKFMPKRRIQAPEPSSFDTSLRAEMIFPVFHPSNTEFSRYKASDASMFICRSQTALLARDLMWTKVCIS